MKVFLTSLYAAVVYYLTKTMAYKIWEVWDLFHHPYNAVVVYCLTKNHDTENMEKFISISIIPLLFIIWIEVMAPKIRETLRLISLSLLCHCCLMSEQNWHPKYGKDFLYSLNAVVVYHLNRSYDTQNMGKFETCIFIITMPLLFSVWAKLTP